MEYFVFTTKCCINVTKCRKLSFLSRNRYDILVGMVYQCQCIYLQNENYTSDIYRSVHDEKEKNNRPFSRHVYGDS
jgi:hypothetical protein